MDKGEREKGGPRPTRGLNLNQQSTLRTAHMCAYHYAQVLYTILHRTVIIFPLILRCCLLEGPRGIGKKSRITIN